jgi:hypothetical protein
MLFVSNCFLVLYQNECIFRLISLWYNIDILMINYFLLVYSESIVSMKQIRFPNFFLKMEITKNIVVILCLKN